MHKQAFDDNMSGTTAITILMDGLKFYVANVGDSRAIIAQEENGRLVAYPLSIDQTPFRYDERERVKKCGAKVMTMDQLEGIEPMHESWGLSAGDEIDNEGDPPRIWKAGTRGPGTAFTRSLGDRIAEELGVFAEPELLSKPITSHDRFIVIASDGVFEFLTNQSVCDIVGRFEDPLQACKAVVAESYRLWLQYEVRTDDITIICIFLDGNEGLKNVQQSIPDNSGEQSTNAAGINSSAEQMLNQELRPVRRNISRAMRTQIVAAQAEIREEKYIIADHITQKTEEEMARIAKAVKANFLFAHLNESQRNDIFHVMQKESVKAGEVVIRQGDEGERFYIVDSGAFEVRLASSPGFKPQDGQLVHTYNSNGGTHPCFGELALMYGKPRAASVIASQDGILWALDRMAFRQILMKTATPVLVKKLRQVEVLKSLNVQQLQRLSDILTEETFEDGEYIIRQGDAGETFYVITSGAASCTVKDDGGAGRRISGASRSQVLNVKEVMRLKEGDYFGERALLNNEPRAANVIAVGTTKCLYIGRHAFEEVLGPLQDIIDEDRKQREAVEMKKQRRRKMTVFQKDLRQCTKLEDTKRADLDFLRSIRNGEMGDISLYVHKKDTNVYTLKTFSKAKVRVSQASLKTCF
jgi:CRP-like cAMP-binding protein/serine/threonine protein phosphatase PrpC